MVTVTIAASVSNLGIVLSLLGATLSSMIILWLPGIIYFKLHSHETYQWKHYLSLCLIAIGVVVLISSVTSILIEASKST